MTNIVESSKKHGIFDKSRKDKKDSTGGYHTIGDSRSSLVDTGVAAVVLDTADQHKVIDDTLPNIINATVNLKKSKTFKIIVNKKSKEKPEKSLKSDNFGGKKPKSKKKLQQAAKRSESCSKKESATGHTQVEEAAVEQRPIFGVSLTESCRHSRSYDGFPLPGFLRHMIAYLEADDRLSFEGVYRIPGVNSQIAKLKSGIHKETVGGGCGGDIESLLANYDIAVITSTVKSFLRDLRPELIEKPVEAMLFQAINRHKDCPGDKVSAIRAILEEYVPIENRYLLALVIGHMGRVIDLSNKNKMSLENLLIVLGPAIHVHFGLLKVFYDHANDLLGDWQAPVYVPPVRPGPEHEEELPETVDGINEELEKQVRFLDDLHEQITEGYQTADTEYLIWEVQLIVTKLKRKKYIAELNDPELIKIELKKYERQLEKLHKDMLEIGNNTVASSSTGGSVSVTTSNVGTDQANIGAPSSVDQELWQVQRTITTLNRKLKALTTNNLSKPQIEVVQPVISSHKPDNSNDDDDDDSVQLNLTLRKLPVDASEDMEDDILNESDKELSTAKENIINQNFNSTGNEINDPLKESAEVISIEVIKSSEEKTSEWLLSDKNTEEMEQDVQSEVPIVTSTGASSKVENEPSICSNGINHTNDDDVDSNYESELTGSNLATCIDDLIQTGEMWTNEKEHLLSEDDDLRNEALRYLYMREELISMKNDLKTRLSSENNEISRLKRNIEELEDEKSQRNFSAQNQYRKLNESSSSPDKEENDDDEENDDSEDDEDEEGDSSDNSESMQYSEQLITARSKENNQEDIADLLSQQKEIILDNKRLEKDNLDLLEQIQLERNHCLELKVALRTHMFLSCPSPWPNLDE